MKSHWMLNTDGNPLKKVHDFIRYIWQQSGLDGMLVSVDVSDPAHTAPHYITDMVFIDQLNPFRPLMEVNTACLIPGLLASQPKSRIGVLLRSCEMRSLVEMTKHTPINLTQLLTISVDCLGTLPADEYQWRLERVRRHLPIEESSDELAHEALKFARQGGIIPYRYRAACQVCSSPAAGQADINLHVLGLPVRQKILASVNEARIAESIGLDAYANGLADKALFHQHQRILSKMSERHTRFTDHLNASLGSLLPADVDVVITQLENCGECQACMQVCPICSVDQPTRDANGHYERSAVLRWLVSCAGCGMCEQSCPKSMPTAAIFAHIRRQLNQQWDYVPGNSLHDPLPFH
jgi:formate dehydrogenase subunit beta